VLELLAVNRLIDPGSEFRLHRQWFDRSAMDVLLGQDFAVAGKDRLYRCLDRVLERMFTSEADFRCEGKSLFLTYLAAFGEFFPRDYTGLGVWQELRHLDIEGF